MHGARLLTEEVPCRIVSRCCLRNLTVRLGLDSVDEIRELDGILDKENRNVVTDNI